MEFALFRLFLTQREQADLFERELGGEPEKLREAWIRHVFSKNIRFVHRRKEYFFVPTEEKLGLPFLAGRIGRQRVVHEAAPPQEGLQHKERNQWQAALIAIDPRGHEDGQKIAIQNGTAVGMPNAVLSALIESLNGREPPEPYFGSVNPIADPQSFWDFVKDNRGQVTSVTFDVVAPNIFGGADNFQKEMRELRDKNKVQRGKFEIKSQEGLELETEQMKEVIDYTTRGGGGVKARAKGAKPYNSKQRVKTVRVDSEDENISDEVILKSVFDDIFKT